MDSTDDSLESAYIYRLGAMKKMEEGGTGGGVVEGKWDERLERIGVRTKPARWLHFLSFVPPNNPRRSF